MTLMIAGLSKSTNYKPNPIGIYGIGIQLIHANV
jgi:hypothetical protein